MRGGVSAAKARSLERTLLIFKTIAEMANHHHPHLSVSQMMRIMMTVRLKMLMKMIYGGDDDEEEEKGDDDDNNNIMIMMMT